MDRSAASMSDEVAGADATEIRVPNPTTSRRALDVRVKVRLYQILVVIAFLLLWQLASDQKWINPFYVSSPSDVASLVWKLAGEQSTYHDVWLTLQETLVGFVASVLIGVLLGFVLGIFDTLSKVFLPLLNLLNTVPRVALAPMFILWFGIGELSKEVLVFSVAVVIMLFNTYSGTQTVERNLAINARLLGANKLQYIQKIVLPWSLPWILTGMRLSLAWSFGAAVIGEYLAAEAGLGWLIFSYAGTLDQTGLLAGCVILLVLSGVLFGALTLLDRVLLRWRPKTM